MILISNFKTLQLTFYPLYMIINRILLFDWRNMLVADVCFMITLWACS